MRFPDTTSGDLIDLTENLKDALAKTLSELSGETVSTDIITVTGVSQDGNGINIKNMVCVCKDCLWDVVVIYEVYGDYCDEVEGDDFEDTVNDKVSEDDDLDDVVGGDPTVESKTF